jgi:hypothetical protein
MHAHAHGALAAGGLALVAVGLAAPAMAIPTAVGSAVDIVQMLEARGFDVILTPVGVVPAAQCSVTAVRLGSDAAESVMGTIQKIVYVDVKC